MSSSRKSNSSSGGAGNGGGGGGESSRSTSSNHNNSNHHNNSSPAMITARTTTKVASPSPPPSSNSSIRNKAGAATSRPPSSSSPSLSLFSGRKGATSKNNSTKQSSNDGDAQDHQRRLEEASAVCARGRQCWTRDRNALEALQEFEHALQLLETLLGTYHSLTAKTYYWLGFIRKHDPQQFDTALKAFVQTARIRLVLLGPSHESTQEAISAIRWVLVHQKVRSQESIKSYLSNLYESIRLETLGDARLRHRDYPQAVDYYQQAMDMFPDSQHATIMGKRAFGAFKQGQLDQALQWYRQALLVFTTQTVHGQNHPDVSTTLERMEQVLQAYTIAKHGNEFSRDEIDEYLSVVVTSVQEQWSGQERIDKGHLIQAQHHLETSLDLERNILGYHHGIVQEVLQPWVKALSKLLNETKLYQRLELISEGGSTNNGAIVVATPKDVVHDGTKNNHHHHTSTSSLPSSSTKDLSQLQSQLQSLQQQLQRTQQERNEWQSKAEHVQLDYMELQSRFDEETTTSTTATTAARQQQEQQLIELQTQVSKLQQENHSLVQELQERQDQLTKERYDQKRNADQEQEQQKHQQQQQEEEVMELEQKLQTQCQEWKDEKVKLERYHAQQVKDVKNQIETLQQQQQEEDTTKLQLRQELEQTHENNQELKCQLEQAREASAKELQEAHSSNEDLKRQLKQTKEEQQEGIEAAKNHHQQQLEDSLQEQERLKQQVQDRQATIDELQERVVQLELDRAELQGRQEILSNTNRTTTTTPVQSPSRPSSSSSPGAISTVSALTLMDDDGGNNNNNNHSTHLEHAQQVQDQLHDQLQELQQHQPEVDVEKLKSQNERAVNTIKALSTQLLGLEEKYRKLGSRYEKLRTMWKDAKASGKLRPSSHKTTSSTTTTTRDSTGDGLPPQWKGKSGDNRVSGISFSSNERGITTQVTGTTGTDITSSTTTKMSTNASSTPTGTSMTEKLQKSVRLSHSSYQSSLGRYILRRPYLLSNDDHNDNDDCSSNDDAAWWSADERRYFHTESSPVCAPMEAYARRAHVQDPSSLEVVALIGLDQSRLYLTPHPHKQGTTQVAHRQWDGTWMDYGLLEYRSEPLGWVTSAAASASGTSSSTTTTNNNIINKTNNEKELLQYYSLDGIVEEAQIYRQHYCQAVLLNAERPTTIVKVLQWMAHRTHSTLLESWAYQYGSITTVNDGFYAVVAAALFGRQPMVILLLIAVTIFVVFLAMWMAK